MRVALNSQFFTRTSMNRNSWILGIGFLIRFVLPTVFPSIPLRLSTSVELATPINSYKSLQEAFFYLANNINPYDGGVNHHPPLLVGFFALFKQNLSTAVFEVFVNLFYSVVDIIIAIRLVKINHWYNAHVSKRRRAVNGKDQSQTTTGLSEELIMSFYLFNPLIILTNIAHTTVLISILFIVESLYQLVHNKNFLRSMVALGIATYLLLSPVLLLAPLLAIAHVVIPVDEISRIYFQGPMIYIMAVGFLVFFSTILTSSASFIDQCYGIIIRFDKLQPNVGLWWYFFTEMFDFFTPFYIGVFNLFVVIFIGPITLRLFEFKGTSGDSFLAFFLCYVWMSFLKSYPTVADLGFAVSLAPIFSMSVLPYCKLIYITGLMFLISLVLSPILYYCWIVLGTGNSNFFYSINLIWGGVHILVLIDFIWGKLVCDYCDEHGITGPERYLIRLTQL